MSGTGPARRIEVDPERIVRWVNGVVERHGDCQRLSSELTQTSVPTSVVLSAADGATAVLEPFVAGARLEPGVPSDAGERGEPIEVGDVGEFDVLRGWAVPPTCLALVLVRRGGYAVGLGQGPELVGHKVGTRYVQSRTAAGGWSQHRFARRRDNQADALVCSVIEHTCRVVLASPSDALVVGGDKSLIRDVLADPRLATLARLPRRELFDLPDPKLVVLKQALTRARAVRITLTDPNPPPPNPAI
ncbi:MAG: hypothetical protein QOE58_1192 [Actinomycetota bacterium]|nr:hypothetical protein [Actinomycetota bacterium]